MKRTKETNRRYRLHQKIKTAFRYSAAKRTVYVPLDMAEMPPSVQELKNRFHYAVQTEIY